MPLSSAQTRQRGRAILPVARLPGCARGRLCHNASMWLPRPREGLMEFYFFHLMPYPDLPADFYDRYDSAWVTCPNELFDARLGTDLKTRVARVLDEHVGTAPVQCPHVRRLLLEVVSRYDRLHQKDDDPLVSLLESPTEGGLTNGMMSREISPVRIFPDTTMAPWLHRLRRFQRPPRARQAPPQPAPLPLPRSAVSAACRSRSTIRIDRMRPVHPSARS